MITIERTSELRSAFLKIGWAPVVTICGVILLCIIAIVIGVGSRSIDDGLSTIKIVLIGGSFISLTGYFLTYAGFSQTHKVLGMSKAGDAVAVLKILFLIFTIIGAIYFLMLLFIPDTTAGYLTMAENVADNPNTALSFSLLIIVVTLVLSIYSIVALFLIKSNMKKLASNTNIRSLNSAYTGALIGVIVFFASLVTGFITGLSAGNRDAAIIPFICELFVIGLSIYGLVKWIGGWLGAATEVMRHEVEVDIEEYNEI